MKLGEVWEDPKPCKVPPCKAKIVWGETLAGQRVPLDIRAQVYRVIHRGPGGRRIVERVEGGMVSHFATCKGRRR